MYIALIAFAAFLFSVQFVFNDRYQVNEGSSVPSAMLFSGITGIVGIAFLALTSRDVFEYSAFSLKLASISAAKNILSAYLTILVLSRANLAIYSLYSMLGRMVLPFGYAILFKGEPFTWQKAACALFIAAALLINLRNNNENGAPGQKTGAPLVLYYAIFVLNGLSGVFSAIHQSAGAVAASAAVYSFMEKAIGIIICAAVLLVYRSRGKRIRLRKPAFSLLSCTCFGIITTLGNLILLIALLHVDASIQYPIVTGGVILLSFFWDWIFVKEPDHRAFESAAAAILGLIFLTF